MTDPVATKCNQTTEEAPDVAPLILTRAELTQLDIPERQSLLGDWLTERHPSMVFAQTGRGKSLFAMSVAIAVAGGGRAFGWQALEPRTVLYVDAEMDRADIKARDGLLSDAVESVDDADLDRNLHLLIRHGQPDGVVFPDLAEAQGQQALLEIVSALKPALVILDNLSTLAEVRDENDAAAFAPVLQTLWRLRQLDCAVLLVHHTGKNGADFRGSSKLAATFESIIKLERPRDLAPEEMAFTIEWRKFRGAPAATGGALRATLVKSSEGAGKWETESAADPLLFEAIKRVRSGDYRHDQGVGRSLGLDKVQTHRLKKKADRLGLLSTAEWNALMQSAREASGSSYEDVDWGGEAAEEEGEHDD
ncbi:MAG: AAA family ATPase [Henriciella sp.]|uniref:AAA family ATPase n=1 Tax=Henriciella sp. TaxID=1968823 RepID=UPI0032F06485